MGLLGTQVSKYVFFTSICYAATLRRRAGYTLGFATHFLVVLNLQAEQRPCLLDTAYH